MRKPTLIALVLCLLVISFATNKSSQAQSSNSGTTIYYTSDGYLYSWDFFSDEVTQLTKEGYIVDLHAAPQGNQIAFTMQYTREFNQIIDDTYYSGMNFAGSDIYLLEAGKISNLSEDDGWVRSAPTWSADGNLLGWWQGEITQARNETFKSLRSVSNNIYDFANNRDYLISSIGGAIDAGNFYVPQPTIFTYHSAVPLYSVRSSYALRVNDLNSLVAHTASVGDWEHTGGADFASIATPDGEYLGIYYRDYGQWDLYNPLNHTTAPLSRQSIDLRSPRADGLRWHYDAIDKEWKLLQSDSTPLARFSDDLMTDYIAMASDGSGAAYFSESEIQVVLNNGNTYSLINENISSIAWGNLGWYLNEIEPLVTTQPEDSSDYQQIHCNMPAYNIGNRGFINIASTPLYAHENPMRFQLGHLTNTMPITLVGGPLCQEGSPDEHWWQIRAYGVSGWAQFNDITDMPNVNIEKVGG